jgi:hypothetical protein
MLGTQPFHCTGSTREGGASGDVRREALAPRGPHGQAQVPSTRSFNSSFTLSGLRQPLPCASDEVGRALEPRRRRTHPGASLARGRRIRPGRRIIELASVGERRRDPTDVSKGQRATPTLLARRLTSDALMAVADTWEMIVGGARRRAVHLRKSPARASPTRRARSSCPASRLGRDGIKVKNPDSPAMIRAREAERRDLSLRQLHPFDAERTCRAAIRLRYRR